MCGRYTLFSDLTTIDTLIGSSLPNEIDGIFGKQHLQNTAHTLPSYNIAPSHIVPPAVGNVRNNGPHLIEPELRLF